MFFNIVYSTISTKQNGFIMKSKIDAKWKPPFPKKKHGESLLHYCAGLGQLDIFKFLCKIGADINAIDDVSEYFESIVLFSLLASSLLAWIIIGQSDIDWQSLT